jgi:hypothetical protein
MYTPYAYGQVNNTTGITTDTYQYTSAIVPFKIIKSNKIAYSNGTFTIINSGVYYFSVNFLVQQSRSTHASALSIKVNNVEVTQKRSFSTSYAGGTAHMTVDVLYYLNVGDTIYIKTINEIAISGTTNSTFQIHRVSS